MAKSNMKPLKVISRNSWMVLAGAVGLCSGIAAWMITGTIDTTVSSVGVVSTNEDSFDFHLTEPGTVAYIWVNKDDYVHVGDVLLEVFDLNSTDDAVYRSSSSYYDENGEEKRRKIRSNYNGYVSSVCVKEWEAYDVTKTIMWICKDSPESEKKGKIFVYAKVSGEYNDQIVPGKTRAIVTAGNHSENIYGHMTGTVVDKSMTPVIKNDLMYWTGSETANDYLLQGESDNECYMVTIELDTDKNTGRSLFSVKQPQNDLIINEKCQVKFIIRQDHPYEKIFRVGGRQD